MRALLAAGLMIGAAACSSAPTGRSLAQDAVTAMGGDAALAGVQSLVMRGGQGTRLRVGQSRMPSDTEEPTTLSNVVETLDLAGGRAAFEYDLAMSGGFSQHRQEILTKKGNAGVGLENVTPRPLAVTSPSGLFSWGTQNSPAFLLRRNVVTIARSAASAAPDEAPADRDLDGRAHKFVTMTLSAGERVGVYFDPESKLIAAYETTDTETMLGDVAAQYRLSDYRAVGGVQIPHAITIRKEGQPYSDVQFASAAINEAAALGVFAIPAAVTAEVDKAIAEGSYSPVTLSKVADGVWFARGYSHHSMVVEFPSFLAVVEAPYTEAQSQTLGRLLQAQFPGKPVRYAAVTHHHYDHTGGARGLAAQGAAIVAERGHAVVMRSIVESRHTNPADELETKRSAQQPVGALEVFDGRRTISEGAQALELYAVAGNPHVDPKVIAYVPRSRILFVSDIWTPGVGAAIGPESRHLLDAIRQLKLPVQTIVGGHGGVGSFAELVKAAAAAPAAATN